MSTIAPVAQPPRPPPIPPDPPNSLAQAFPPLPRKVIASAQSSITQIEGTMGVEEAQANGNTLNFMTALGEPALMEQRKRLNYFTDHTNWMKGKLVVRFTK